MRKSSLWRHMIRLFSVSAIMSNCKVVYRSQCRPGPICQESLPYAMLANAEAVFDAIGPYLGMTLEQFEHGSWQTWTRKLRSLPG